MINFKQGENKNDLTVLNLDNLKVELKSDIENQTLWGTQDQIASIFKVDSSGISRHINSIIKDGELQEKSNVQKMHIANSDKPVKHYNLDMMIAVGYRVNSKKATEFRKIATQVISQFITKGIVINKDKISTKELATTLRKLRNEEKSFYAVIKDIFKESASDYDIAPREQKQKFFSLVQDKFLFAVTGKTTYQLMLENADAGKVNMGLQNFDGVTPLTSDITIGKNYIDKEKFEELEILCENFLGFCHLKAFRQQVMTFDEITYKLNSFLEFNGYQLFNKYNQPNRKDANLYVKKEFKKYKEAIKLEKKKAKTIESKK